MTSGISYTYDANGNILTKTDHSTNKTITYGYTDPTWADLLTSYNGQTITYDENGNPLHYNNGTAMDFSWVFGRSLYTVNIGDKTIRYAYDQEGTRTSKTIGNTYTKYHIIDGVLYGEKTTGSNGTTEIFYFYDDNERMYGFSYNGTMYYYQFNLQGDVTGIYDANGQLVVEYKYDAWGKVLSITGSLANSIGQNNPIRYRGYYYDNETGFYYINIRYYDPEIGRFLNSDSVIAGVGDSILGYNMFAYCFNNPVNMSDPSGNWPKWAKEIVNRVEYAVTITFRIFTSPLKAVDAKVGLGVGIGGEFSGKVKGISASVTAKKSYTDSLQIKNGNFDIKSSDSQEIGLSVGELSIGKSSGQEHSLFDKNCTCDLINTPIVRQAECYANKEFIEENYTIGVSASLYFGIGGEVSLGININDFFDELIDIYHTEYVGYY